MRGIAYENLHLYVMQDPRLPSLCQHTGCSAISSGACSHRTPYALPSAQRMCHPKSHCLFHIETLLQQNGEGSYKHNYFVPSAEKTAER